MAAVIFYGKPTCAGNLAQQAALAEAGHEVEFRDLFTYPWTRERLQEFVEGSAQAAWFNRAAKRIKAGEIVPDAMDGERALTLLISDPTLLRRPLLEIGGLKLLGWDPERLDILIGLKRGRAMPTKACRRQSAP